MTTYTNRTNISYYYLNIFDVSDVCDVGFHRLTVYWKICNITWTQNKRIKSKINRLSLLSCAFSPAQGHQRTTAIKRDSIFFTCAKSCAVLDFLSCLHAITIFVVPKVFNEYRAEGILISGYEGETLAFHLAFTNLSIYIHTQMYIQTFYHNYQITLTFMNQWNTNNSIHNRA